MRIFKATAASTFAAKVAQLVEHLLQTGHFLHDYITLWVINVLNTQNVIGVFNTSGDAYDDGYLATDQGKAAVEGYRTTYGQAEADLYKQL